MRYMVLEYAKNRELFDYIVYAGEGLGETYAKIIFKKILNGMKCIHESGYCHKDLSLSNIFLDENYEPKIGDFGAAMKNNNDLKEFIGTREFKAPEIIKKKAHDGQKADIFSLGQILIYLVFGKKGFDIAHISDPMYKLIIEKDKKEKKEEIEECLNNYWEKMRACISIENVIISEEFKDLYMKMICEDPLKRLNIDEILEHLWIKSESNIEKIEYKNLKKEFIKRIPKILIEIKKELKKMKDDNLPLIGNKSNTKAIKKHNIFNSEKKPKTFPEYYNENFCIKFQDYYNANKLMNSLYNKIDNIFEDECNIEPDADKYKMIINFEDEQGESIYMKIKLYQFKNGLILKFFRKQGNKARFFEKFKEIFGLLSEKNN